MAARNEVPHLSIDQRQVRGQQPRDRAPLSSHTGWEPAADRPDPVALLEEQDTTREPDLVPVRHGRMLVSPFTLREYRQRKTFTKASTRDSLQALSKLGELVDGRYRIVSQPPVIVPARDLQAEHGLSRDEVERGIREHSAPTGPPSAATTASYWSGWLGWAASAPGPISSCSRDATSTTRCSCR